MLLELSRLSLEKSGVDPRQKLGPILKEIKNLQKAIENGRNKRGLLAQSKADKSREMQETKDSFEKMEQTINKGKERMARVKGMSLKEMLAIQQAVAKAEENLLLGESRVIQLAKEIKDFEAENHKIKDSIAELKQQYNEKAAFYNTEKQRMDLQQAALLSAEETLRATLDSEILAFYDESARRVGVDPVAVLRNGVCSGCRVGVSIHMAKLVRQTGTLQRCENCYRVLLPESLDK